jgi:aminopeptidase N
MYIYVSYIKGYNFLSYLENVVGSEAFKLFVKAYVVKW